MRTLRRAALVVALVIVVIAVAGWLGLRAYLSSSGARELAAGRLSEAIGLPVEVDDLNVGFASSSMAFRVVQPAADGRPPAEVLRVESATADVAIADLAAGRARPTELTVRGLALTLHFDRDGKLLTKLPESKGDGDPAFPAVRAEGVSLTVKQDGRPDFVLTNARLDATPEDGKITIRGPIVDPNWGKWDVNGTIEIKSGTARLELTAVDAPLKMDLLRSIPFVPEVTWVHVRPAGTTAARVTLATGEDKKIGYDVVLKPTGTARVGLPDLDATIEGVAGTIRVHDAKVELADCTGTLAGGSVRLGGDLDFAPEPSVLTFRVAVEGLDVQNLPAEWRLPDKLEGKLRGKAELVLKVPEKGSVVPQGGGAAVVDEAKLAGFPAEVRLRLRGDGKRYRFDTAPQADTDKPKTSRANPFRGDVVFVTALRRTAARPQPPAAPPKNGDTEPTTLDATVRLRDVDIAELLTRLEVKIPYRLGGKVTVEATVTIPVAQADNLKTYRVVGRVTSPEARFEDARVRDFSARIEYANGVLKLTELRGSLPPEGTGSPGSFTGTATAAVEPRGDLTASLDLTRVPLGEAAKAVPGGGIDLAGTVTGRAEFRAPLDRLSDAATWVGSADVASAKLGVFGRTVRKAAVKVRVDRGTATLADARGVVEGLPLTVEGSLGLTRPYKFAGTVTTSPLDVADIRRLVAGADLPFAVEGKVDATARVSGTLDPLAFTAGGTAKATDLTIGTSEGNKVGLKWDLDRDRVKVTDLTADLFGGTVTGSAEVPLDVTKAGRFALAFTNLDAGPATKAVPDFPVRLTGRVSGKFAAEVPAAKPGQPRAVSADLDLTAPKLTVQGIPAERLSGKVAIAGGVARYTLEGRALGGTFDVKGRYPSRPKADPPAPDRDDRGTLRIRGMDLRQLADVFKAEALRPLRGRVDVTLNYNDDLADGSGRVSVSSLRWANDPVATDLVGVLRVRDGTLTLTDFGGGFAGGTLRGRARVNMSDPGRNFFLVTVDRADARRLFAPAPGLADAATGSVSVVLRGRMGAETRGSGEIAFDRGTLFGLDATALRVPFDWALGTGGSGRLTVREGFAIVGHGRLTGQATYDWGVTGRLSGQVRFSDVRLQNVLGDSRLFGSGRITGRFDFGGSNVRSVDDVSGTLTAALNQASVQELPILRQLTPYLAPFEAVRPFQAGEVRGRLAGGVFRIDRLAMSNPSAQLFAEGTVTLAGRLDLDVVAKTGRIGIDDRALRLFGLRLPAVGPVPVTLIRDVSDFLSNRTVRLRVTGTVDRPVVSVNTAALLSEEAIRFFLTRSVPAIATGGVTSFILPAVIPEPEPRRP
jgi:hypothetical protein